MMEHGVSGEMSGCALQAVAVAAGFKNEHASVYKITEANVPDNLLDAFHVMTLP